MSPAASSWSGFSLNPQQNSALRATCTVQWGRALQGAAKASHHPGSGHCQVEPSS